MIGNDWDIVLAQEFREEYFLNLNKLLQNDYLTKTIYPPYKNIFRALKLCSYKDTLVIILGQDPYYNPNQADGLAFSVPKGEGLPPSLRNIYQEIENELGIKMSNNGDLSKWAKQGILLLNTALTVVKGMPNSHVRIGWEKFTDAIISKLSLKQEKLIFVLWGNNAIKKESLIDSHHYILKATHPSPLSAYCGFFGCGHFLEINRLLEESGKKAIDWLV